jgi:hypothetical protein
MAEDSGDRNVTMDIRLHIDPDTNLPHIFEHGVTEDEVREVLRKPGEDRSGDEGSRVAIGQTVAGRYLKVIYARDTVGDGVFVITAYDLKRKPLNAFRRRQRRKRK